MFRDRIRNISPSPVHILVQSTAHPLSRFPSLSSRYFNRLQLHRAHGCRFTPFNLAKMVYIANRWDELKSKYHCLEVLGYACGFLAENRISRQRRCSFYIDTHQITTALFAASLCPIQPPWTRASGSTKFRVLIST